MCAKSDDSLKGRGRSNRESLEERRRRHSQTAETILVNETTRRELEHTRWVDMAKATTASVVMYPLLMGGCLVGSPFGQDHPLLSTFLMVGISLLSLQRYHVATRILKGSGDIPPQRIQWYCFAAVGLGIVWGLFNCLMIYHYQGYWSSQLATLIGLGLIAGASSSFVSSYRLFAAFSAVTMVPPMVSLIFCDGPVRFSVLPLTLFGIFSLLTAKVHNERYLTSICNEILLKKRSQELAMANESKNEFLATMSHEIRTPMNAMCGTTELLIGTTLDSGQHDLVQKLRDSSHGLLQIISDILDLSKIEAGRLQLEESSFNLHEVVTTSVSIFDLVARQNNLNLVRNFTGLPADFWAKGDKIRLQQIVTNLVSNAVKFTPKGSVRIQAGVQLVDGAFWLELDVTDTGIGIDPAHMNRLFRPFSQVDASITRQYGGTGLGLAISLRFVELMQGYLWAESGGGTVGQIPPDYEPLGWPHGENQSGSKFSIRLPLTACQPVVEPVDTSSPLQLSSELRVLLVEDNLVNQRIAYTMLGKLGLKPEVVNNGEEAITAVANQPFEVIFMDLQMPVMDGITATEAIRRMQLPYQPCIFALTANAFQDDRERCAQVGMDGFITKPVRLEDFVGALRRFDNKVTSEGP